jgi:hypothetical protein
MHQITMLRITHYLYGIAGGGIGYAGTESDTKKVKRAAVYKQKRDARQDAVFTEVIKALNDLLQALLDHETDNWELLTNVLLGPGFGDGFYLKKVVPGAAPGDGSESVGVELIKSKKYVVGAGDGIFGISTLYTCVSNKLRMTMVDIQSGTSQQRDFWFALVILLQKLGRFPKGAFAPVLLYAPRRDSNATVTDKGYAAFDMNRFSLIKYVSGT